MQPRAARQRGWATKTTIRWTTTGCIIVGVQATGARLSEESRAAEEMIPRFTQ